MRTRIRGAVETRDGWKSAGCKDLGNGVLWMCACMSYTVS